LGNEMFQNLKSSQIIRVMCNSIKTKLGGNSSMQVEDGYYDIWSVSVVRILYCSVKSFQSYVQVVFL
jgi:hypothetical protein